MALFSSMDDYRVSAQTARDDAAANAPEVDDAVHAPEYRGSNIPPEVIKYLDQSKYHAEDNGR